MVECCNVEEGAILCECFVTKKCTFILGFREGMLSYKDRMQEDRFQQDLMGSFNMGGLVVSMTSSEITAYWLLKFNTYYQEYVPAKG